MSAKGHVWFSLYASMLPNAPVNIAKLENGELIRYTNMSDNKENVMNPPDAIYLGIGTLVMHNGILHG